MPAADARRRVAKASRVQAGDRHFGVFIGKQWTGNIYPVARGSIRFAQRSGSRNDDGPTGC